MKTLKEPQKTFKIQYTPLKCAHVLCQNDQLQLTSTKEFGKHQGHMRKSQQCHFLNVECGKSIFFP